jgi:hypothetical protein
VQVLWLLLTLDLFVAAKAATLPPEERKSYAEQVCHIAFMGESHRINSPVTQNNTILIIFFL